MSHTEESAFQEAVADHLAGRLETALLGYGRVLGSDPSHVQALHLGGAAAFRLERMAEAVDLFRRAIDVAPESGVARMCLGQALGSLGRTAEAEENLREGIALESANPEAWLNLGIFLLGTGRAEQSMVCFQRAVHLRPGFAAAVAGIGSVLKQSGRLDLAEDRFGEALSLDPLNEPARLGLIQVLQAGNRVAEALRECATLTAARPKHLKARSHRLFLLNYCSEVSREAHFDEHRAFGLMLPAAPGRVFAADRDPCRRLRVGFLSPDLRTHSVSRFLLPLLAHLDQAQFDVVLYHDHPTVDEVSGSLASRAAIWKNFSGWNDASVEAAIRADAPDVLFDLAGHTGQNRLPLFARRLAPVQIAYLGYPATTGLREMDYRFTDSIVDPAGAADALFTERLVRFSECAWSFDAPDMTPDVRRARAARTGGSVFGSFNSLSKIDGQTLRLWRSILESVPGSSLVIKSHGLKVGAVQAACAAAGIEVARVRLLPADGPSVAHLARYGEIDIALDPLPYSGTTTTCEALWMGCPVVTLAGDRHARRVGASLLAAVGHSEWVAHDAAEYVSIACRLASDRGGLLGISEGLRPAMARSRLMDHPGQAARFGAAIRDCWSNWCRGEVRPVA